MNDIERLNLEIRGIENEIEVLEIELSSKVMELALLKACNDNS